MHTYTGMNRASERSARALRSAHTRDLYSDLLQDHAELLTQIEAGLWRLERKRLGVPDHALIGVTYYPSAKAGGVIDRAHAFITSYILSVLARGEAAAALERAWNHFQIYTERDAKLQRAIWELAREARWAHQCWRYPDARATQYAFPRVAAGTEIE